MGALLGDEAIPGSWVDRLENSQEISKIATEMYWIFKEQASDF